MGTIIGKHFDFCYNIGGRQLCILQQENNATAQENRRLYVIDDKKNQDGQAFQNQLNLFLTQLQKKGKNLQIETEKCDPDTNTCKIDFDFS